MAIFVLIELKKSLDLMIDFNNKFIYKYYFLFLVYFYNVKKKNILCIIFKNVIFLSLLYFVVKRVNIYFKNWKSQFL